MATCEAVARLLFDTALIESGFQLPDAVSHLSRLQPLLAAGLASGYADVPAAPPQACGHFR